MGVEYSTTYTEKKYVDDLVRSEYDQNYTRDGVKVYNRTNAVVSISNVLGQPIEPDESVAGAYMFCVAARIQYAVGVILDIRSFASSTLADNASFTTKALMRGPAIIDKTALPATDAHGDAITVADFVTSLSGLNPAIKSVPEHTKTVTQTT